jgi:hypothetical protein
LRDVIIFLAVNCDFVANKGHGARCEIVSTGATTLRFIGCSFGQNDGKGVEARNTFGLTFLGCVFEGNKGGWQEEEGNGLDAVSCGRMEVLSCHFEDAATATAAEPLRRTQQYIWLNACFGTVVDGCFFQGNQDGPVPHVRPHSAVHFENSGWSRLSNNAAEALITEFAFFSSDSNECVELGNHDRTSPDNIARITMVLNARVVSMSRRALGLPTHAVNGSRPPAAYVRPGSLIWNAAPEPATDSKLQVWDGNNWRSVLLGP